MSSSPRSAWRDSPNAEGIRNMAGRVVHLGPARVLPRVRGACHNMTMFAAVVGRLRLDGHPADQRVVVVDCGNRLGGRLLAAGQSAWRGGRPLGR